VLDFILRWFKPKPKLTLPEGYRYIPAEEFVKRISPRVSIDGKTLTYVDAEPMFLDWTEIITKLAQLVENVDPSRCFFGDLTKIAYTLYDYETTLERFKIYDAKTGQYENVWEVAYSEPTFDCEDYSLMALAALHQPYTIAIPAFAILWVIHPTYGLAHALNFCVDADETPYLYESQLNCFYSKPEVRWKFYMMLI